MPVSRYEDLMSEVVENVAKLVLASAKTAPKARGIDRLVYALITGGEKEKLADQMEAMAEERPIFPRDAKNVRDSDAVVVIGLADAEPLGLDCGACGFQTCDEFSKAKKTQGRFFQGPQCMMHLINLGIAIGSAAKTAGVLNVDNRVMFTIGAAAIRAGLVKAEVAFGIPLSTTGKSIYFDRQT